MKSEKEIEYMYQALLDIARADIEMSDSLRGFKSGLWWVLHNDE